MAAYNQDPAREPTATMSEPVQEPTATTTEPVQEPTAITAEPDTVAITPAALLGKLRKQLGKKSFYGLPRTDGTFASVLWESFRQEGVFMAPFTAHAEHPLTPLARWLLLACSLSSTIFMTAFMTFVEEQSASVCQLGSEHCSGAGCDAQSELCQEVMKAQMFVLSIQSSIFSTILHAILRCVLECKCLLMEESNTLQRKASSATRVCLSAYVVIWMAATLVLWLRLNSMYMLVTVVMSFIWNTILFEPLTKTASLLWSFKKQQKAFWKSYVVSGIAPEGTVSLTQVAEAVLATCQTASPPAVPTGFVEHFGIGKPPRQSPCSRIVGATGRSSMNIMSNDREKNTQDGDMFHERLLG